MPDRHISEKLVGFLFKYSQFNNFVLNTGYALMPNIDGKPDFEAVNEINENEITDAKEQLQIMHEDGKILSVMNFSIIETLVELFYYGNHDRFISNAKAKNALAGIKDLDDITVKLEDGTTRRCILSHYFMPFYNCHHFKAIHLHGHSHNTEEAKVELEIAEQLNEKGFINEIYNVGCMHWNYEPVTLDEILKTASQKEWQ